MKKYLGGTFGKIEKISPVVSIKTYLFYTFLERPQNSQVFITRLLSEECLPRVPDLAPRGIAAFAHAVTKLGQEARP